MTLTLVLLVLGAALLHAVWSTFAKAGGAPEFTIAGFLLVRSAACLPLLAWVDPPAPGSWPILGASLAFHTAYYLTLSQAYRVGDVSQVYPIFRGSAPVLVAAAGIVLAGERLNPAEWCGMAVICGSIISLAAHRSKGQRLHLRPVVWGLVTGLLVACYTVADGLGVRAAGSRAGFIAWLFVLEVVPLGLLLLAARPRVLGDYLRVHWRSSVAGGLSLTLSYGIVIYAMSRGAMAVVSALRETSVIFAALLGTLVLREPLGRYRVAAAAAVAGGVILMHVW